MIVVKLFRHLYIGVYRNHSNFIQGLEIVMDYVWFNWSLGYISPLKN